jgi:hypothetical protein
MQHNSHHLGKSGYPKERKMMHQLISIFVVAVLLSSASSAGCPECKCDSSERCKIEGNYAACKGDCSCNDFMYDKCPRAHPVTSVHAIDVYDCMGFCEVFHMENRCQFIIYSLDNVDENCKVMDENMYHYVDGCQTKGAPLWTDTAGSAVGTCVNDSTGASSNSCPSKNPSGHHPYTTECKDCCQDPCHGIKWMDCTNYAENTETADSSSYELCMDLARQARSVYTVFNKEEQQCLNYKDGDRECKEVVIEYMPVATIQQCLGL